MEITRHSIWVTHNDMTFIANFTIIVQHFHGISQNVIPTACVGLWDRISQKGKAEKFSVFFVVARFHFY